MILLNNELLNKECKNISIFESYSIIDKLNYELNKAESGIGLAANQIGIDAKVCIIRLPFFRLDLVNPEIINKFDLIEFEDEGCLSFPKKTVKTSRYNEILVRDSLHQAGMICVGIEAIAIQHEVDHLYGITMYDRAIDTPAKNELCWCDSRKKYKKCHYGKVFKQKE